MRYDGTRGGGANARFVHHIYKLPKAHIQNPIHHRFPLERLLLDAF